MPILRERVTHENDANNHGLGGVWPCPDCQIVVVADKMADGLTDLDNAVLDDAPGRGMRGKWRKRERRLQPSFHNRSAGHNVV